MRYKNVALGFCLQPKVNIICVKGWGETPGTVLASLPFVGFLKPGGEVTFLL